jgi:hypothetical protein
MYAQTRVHVSSLVSQKACQWNKSVQCDHCMLKLNPFSGNWNENQMFGIYSSYNYLS